MTAHNDIQQDPIERARQQMRYVRQSGLGVSGTEQLLERGMDHAAAERDSLAAIVGSVRDGVYAAREHASYGNSSIDGDVLAEGIEELLSESLADALAAVKEAVWDEVLDEIEEHEINTAQAREGNPYRKS